ncbi:MAG: ATP-binding cassette domain-containing protein [Aquisalinus sp.]|nr:ATP-binding cassette domain-containing protein [Aquisalinus sp.]
MAPPLLTLQDIHLTFGGTPLLTGANLTVHEKDRLCLVGRNGSGKSTLMKIAAGLVEADKGEIISRPDITVRYLEQDPDFSESPTVRAYAEQGLAPGDAAHNITLLLEQVGLTGEESPAQLSGGEARRAALVRALAPEPDILLLDEPTNHLDLPTIEWLEKVLGRSQSALILISHDRRFLENMTRKTVWLDRGQTRELNEGFSGFENWRDTVLEQEELERHKLDRKIVREEHWITYGVTARRKRNVRRLKELDALRQTRKEAAKTPGKAKLEAFESSQSGKLVIEAAGLSKAYGDKTLINNFSLRLNRGDRVGITGPNGSGKTTLLNLLLGQLQPDKGSVRLGTNLEILTLDQQRATLKPETRLVDAVTGGRGDSISVGGQMRNAISYLKDFLFLPEQARSPINALSGGEKGRLALAIAFASPSNLLVLDEPTNDLDLETLDLVQEMLSAYQGTVLLVSHDRDFLDRTVTSTLTPEGKGLWREYPGGYSDMKRQQGSPDAQERKATAPASSRPMKTQPKTAAVKLSYKEKYALDTLPGEIEALQELISDCQQKMADPDLFSQNPEKFNTMAARLDKAQKDLSIKEELWLELEMKRENLEG